jgi:hypothetical protein
LTPTDTRTGTVATVARPQEPAHQHTGSLASDHLTAVVAIGALLWLLGTAFVLSWRDSGHRLRGILGEFDEPCGPHADQRVDLR